MEAKRIISIALSLAILPAGVTALYPAQAQAAGATVVRLDPSDASPFNNGEFQGWGTSLCWWANRLGYSEKLTKQAADAFFSEEGLGLDIARYNLGGGDDPSHNHITRSDSKVPGVWKDFKLSADGKDVKSITYDITKDQNQLNIAKAALEANPDLYFEGFSNSPPYFMTNSGCTSGGTQKLNSKNEPYSDENNLKDDFYDDFGKFIADATALFKDQGIVFKSYSPMNEPDTTYWFENSGKQEGSHFDPGSSQSNMIIETRKALDDAGLTDVIVAGMDETDINKSVTNYAALSDEAKTALGRIDTHTYSGSNRSGLKATAINANKDLWMSEVDGGWDGFGLANRIILDMNGMQPAAWVMWDIVDRHKDSKFTAPDGSHPEANASLGATDSLWGVGMADHDTEKLELANKYYFFGQFTKYINPGDTIIASSDSTLAAYNKKTGAIKIVALNSSGSKIDYEFDMSAFAEVPGSARVIRTNNSNEKWADLGKIDVIDKKLAYTLSEASITTFVLENDAVITNFNNSENGLSYSYNVSNDFDGYDKYFAVYSSDGRLKYVSVNNPLDSVEGDFSDSSAKLYVWNRMEKVVEAIDTVGVSNDYAIITGGGKQISLGASVTLSVNTNINGDIEWSSSNESVASISPEGTVTANKSGDVTIYAKVGDLIVSRAFEIPLYTLTGTTSWGNDSNRPKDSDDYTKAADGYLDTYFDGTTGGWVQYDYGASFKPSKISLAARSGSGMADRTKGGRVQASNDGIEWTDLYTLSSAIAAGSYTEITADNLASDKAYRYFRYTNTENMANIAEFLIEGEPSEDTPDNAPVVTDIDEFTDDFEGSSNIFDAAYGNMADGGNVVFSSGLDRFANVFAPVRSTAVSELAAPISLTNNDKLRLTFNMFAGWENNGKDNTFMIKDSEGKELVAIYMTGGGYNINQIRIGGKDVLGGAVVGQCRSNPGDNKAGANGWNASGQPYVNTVGYNKTVEIIIGGTGAVSVSATGGMADTSVSGTLTAPITIGSIELTGNYNAAAERTVSYDNFDADLITYAEALPEPTPAPTPSPTPEPTDPPVIPASGELINLSFDNGDLKSASSYGKAEGVGTPKFATVDDKTCLQLDGTRNTAIKLTDANGNSLLTGQKTLTISFKMKPTVSTTSWWFYAAPTDAAQTYLQEKYLGAMTKEGTLSVERYNNSGSRSAAATGSYKANEWNDVKIVVADGETVVYINGVKSEPVSSTVDISQMLGESSVAYIGLANWNSGEFATGYIDDFVITNSVYDPLAEVDLGDTSSVKADMALPITTPDGEYVVSWSSSHPEVISSSGKVTRGEDTTDVVLTATATRADSAEVYTREFNINVIGLTAVIDTFAVYTEGKSIKFTSDYSSDEVYDMNVSYTLKDTDSLEETVSNTASGSFDNLANGTYIVDCWLADKENAAEKKRVTKTVKITENEEMDAYLFAHFVGTESDENCEQIYFSVSTDGSTWKTLNNGKPMLTSTVGEKGVRDPYILRGEDGKFFVIATDLSIYNRRGDSNRWSACQTSGSKSIVIWESDDLVNWSEASLVKVAKDNAGCTWAPEAVYDNEKDAYMVFWASKTADDNYATQRIYRSYTKDFKTFTEPEIYIDGGTIGNIDTTIVSDRGVYYRFTKNETRSSVTMMKSNSLSGKWEDVETYAINNIQGNTITGYEGPTIYRLNNSDKWCLLLDYYSKSQGYKPFVTDDITKGAFTSASDFTFDATYRHGTVMPITAAEYERLTGEKLPKYNVYPISNYSPVSDNSTMMITSMSQSKDEDGEYVYTIKGYSGGVSVTYTTDWRMGVYYMASENGAAADSIQTSKEEYKGELIFDATKDEPEAFYKALKVGDVVGIQSTGSTANVIIKMVDAEDIAEDGGVAKKQWLGSEAFSSIRDSITIGKVNAAEYTDTEDGRGIATMTVGDTQIAYEGAWSKTLDAVVITLDKDGKVTHTQVDKDGGYDIIDVENGLEDDAFTDYAFVRQFKGGMREIYIFRIKTAE